MKINISLPLVQFDQVLGLLGLGFRFDLECFFIQTQNESVSETHDTGEKEYMNKETKKTTNYLILNVS